jgi:putative ABC transport system substrate-binding protein
MNRRDTIAFLLASGMTGTAFRTLAQSVTSKFARIGIISGRSRAQASYLLGLPEPLNKLGWTEGRNVIFEWRFADGRMQNLPRLATELVALRPDVIVCIANPEAKAVLQITRTIPIVIWITLDPVGIGMARSLAHPGGNVTGLLWADPELASKSVELLHDAVPNMQFLGAIYDGTHPGIQPYINADGVAAQKLGVRLRTYPVRNAEELSIAFETIRKDKVDGLMVGCGGLILGVGLRRVIEFAAANSIPAWYSIPEPVEQGGFFSYCPDRLEVRTRVAAMVDRILRGAKPGEIAFEYATRFDLTVNLKTAKALGLNLPQSFLLQADRVIE